MQESAANKTQRYRERIFLSSKYFLLTVVLSLLGWVYEVLLVRVQHGHWTNRGFLRLPLCPIYGCTLLFTYFFIGLPIGAGTKKAMGESLQDKNRRGILKWVENPTAHTLLYLLFAFLIPTAAELLVGLVFDRAFHLSLWSYVALPFNYRGYISLPISLVWALLIYLFMRFLFLPLKRWVFALSNTLSLSIATLVFFVTAVDVVMSFVKI